jgi:SAM-dependent methyltransferase
VRTILYDLLRRIVATSPPQPVVEFGSARAPTQTHLPSVRSVFTGLAFSGTDMNPGVGVDQLQDLRQLGLRDGSVGTALLLDTIEHVEDPRQAMAELRRCIAPEGLLLLTTHFFFPIHQHPADYWRFTADGVDSLLKEFPFRYAAEGGLRLFPHSVVGLAGGHALEAKQWDSTVKAVDEWVRFGASSWKERAMNVLPPILTQQGYKRYAKLESRKRVKTSAPTRVTPFS